MNIYGFNYGAYVDVLTESLLLSSSIMVTSQYLCHVPRLPCAWWRNPEYFLLQPVCSDSSENHGSRCLGEVHRFLEGVKLVQSELMEVTGFHPKTPSINTRSYLVKVLNPWDGTWCTIHPRETVDGFRRAFPSCAVVELGGVGPAAALLCPAAVQRSEERITLVQSIKNYHLQVT